MPQLEAFGAIVEEHDAVFGVKKVSLFLANGSSLVRAAGDGNGNLLLSEAGYSSVTSVNATNNSAGTAVQLASAACKMVEIFVPTGNTSSQIAVGDSGCKSAGGSEKGVIMISGSSNKFYVTNANLLWFDVGTNGDKISYNIYN